MQFKPGTNVGRVGNYDIHQTLFRNQFAGKDELVDGAYVLVKAGRIVGSPINGLENAKAAAAERTAERL